MGHTLFIFNERKRVGGGVINVAILPGRDYSNTLSTGSETLLECGWGYLFLPYSLSLIFIMRDEKWAELEELLFVFVCTRSTTTWIHILLVGRISLGCCYGYNAGQLEQN